MKKFRVQASKPIETLGELKQILTQVSGDLPDNTPIKIETTITNKVRAVTVFWGD